MTLYLSAGVYPLTIDRSQFPQAIAPFIAGMVYQSNRGPTGLYPYFERETWMKLNGNPDITVSYGGYMADHYFDNGSYLWGYRVPGVGARWATGSVVQQPNLGNTANIATESIPGPGYVNDPALVVNGIGQALVYHLIFSAPLIALNVFNVSINTTAIAPVTYQATSNNTMRQIAASIQTVLASLGSFGRAFVLPQAAGDASTTDQQIIRIVAPLSATTDAPIALSFTSNAVTSGASQATTIIAAPKKLFDVWAMNPGSWGDNIAYSLTPIGVGTPPVLTLTFNAAFVTANVINAVINGTAIAPVTFTTDNDTTLAAVAVALQTTMRANIDPTCNAVAVSIAGAATNDRQIILTGPTTNTVDIVLDNVVVTLGAGQAVASVAQTTTRIPPSNRFQFALYEYPNMSTPVESFICSLRNDRDAQGNNYNLEYQINTAPGKSNYIRVALNPALLTTDNLLSSVIPQSAPVRYGFLLGGANGATATTADITAGYDQFASRETVDVRCLINAGYTDPVVAQKMASVCAKRMDCVALIDIPDGLTASAINSWRYGTLNIDNYFAWAFGPWTQVYDQVQNTKIWVPMSGQVASLMAANASRGETFRSTAGMNRSKLARTLALRYTFVEGERDLLTSAGVNYARQMAGVYIIENNATLQVAKSYLSYTNVVLMILQLNIVELNSFIYYEFEPNQPDTWFRMRQLMTTICQTYQDAGGIDSFTILCDSTTNTNALIARGQMRMIVGIIPTVEASEIIIDNVIMAHGMQLSEVLPTIV